MQKIRTFLTPLVVLSLITLVSCTDSGSSGNSDSGTFYSYGSQELPGSLSHLTASYRPANLSAKVFTSSGQTYAPMDMQQQNLSITFDVSAQTAVAHSVITFLLAQDSYPYFQLNPTVTAAKLDGNSITVSQIADPDHAAPKLISLNQLTTAGPHTLELDYNLSADSFSFRNGGVAILTDMTDLPDSHYFEVWGPTNFEDDPFKLTLHLKILNSTANHQLFTNGRAQDLGGMEWQIQFPAYFTTSSIFFHLTNTGFLTKQLTITGKEKQIPVTLYSSSQSILDQAAAMLPGLFQEFERDYGPYAHDSFTAFLQSGGGGMEYSGATITSVGALDHELFHSWFARGVMPAEGRSGWIDEAFASWRDYDYFQASSLLSRTPTLLADFSPYRQATPDNCYRDGRRLVAELDRVFAAYGGMKPLMKLFFARYSHHVVTNEELWNFLSSMTMLNVDAYFQRYTLNQAAQDLSSGAQELFVEPGLKSKHPAPLTRSDVEKLR